MTKINLNFVVGANSADKQAHSKRSPSRGEGQFVAGTDRLELGLKNVSTEEAVKILVERLTSRIYDALREALVDVSRGPTPDVSPDSPAEVVSQRIFTFALGFFDEFKASQGALDEAGPREQFARLVGEAISKGFSETHSLLHGLKVFLSLEASSKIERIVDLIAKMLEEFVAVGVEGTKTGSRSMESSTAGTPPPPPEAGQPSAFVPREAGGGEFIRAQNFQVQQEASPTKAGPGSGRQEAGGTVKTPSARPQHARRGVFPTGAKGEAVARGDQVAGGRPTKPFAGGAESAPVPAQKAQADAGGPVVERGEPLLLGGGELSSAERVVGMIGERIIANMKSLIGAAGGESAPEPIADLPAAPPPEVMVRHISDFVVRSFDKFLESSHFASELQDREHFASMVGEAITRGISETRVFIQTHGVVLSGEAASSVDKMRNLLAKMVDEFVAEGLRDPSGKFHFADPAPASPSQASPEQGRGANFFPSGDPSMEGSSLTERPSSSVQAQLIPPESTVLAMTKKSLSKKMYALSEPETSLIPVAYKPSLLSLLGTLFGTAAILNYPWELSHLLLSGWYDATWTAVIFASFRAALGDGLLILALYGMGCALFKNKEWILESGLLGYAFLAFSGMAVAVGIEWQTMVWSRWAPNTLMPLVPVVGVGLFPVLQLMVLPPLVAYATRLWLKRSI